MLEREDVARISAEALALFIKEPPRSPQTYSVRPTSGTAGQGPILSVVTHAVHARLYRGWWTGAERTLLCAGSVALRFLYTALISEAAPSSRVMALDRADLDESRASLVQDFAPDRIIGTPSFIAHAAHLFAAHTAAHVRTIKCFGEGLSQDHQDVLKKTFPNAIISSGYFSMEIGPFSVETCGFRPLNFFHPADTVRIEIHEPDEQGIGDVLVSAHAYGGLPIENYRTGDVARLHPGECACGAETTFELLGRRGYDYLKLAGALLVRAEFDRVVALFPDMHDYRVEATTVSASTGMMGKVTVIAYAPRVPTDARQREIAAVFAKSLFVTHDRSLADLVAQSLFVPLSINWTNEPFPAAYKTIKLKSV